MSLNQKPLEVMCNNKKSIIELTDNHIHIKTNNTEEKIDYNQITEINQKHDETYQLNIKLNNQNSYTITPTSMFDKVYINDIYQTITDKINNYTEDILYTFEGIDIKESETLLQLFNIYTNQTEYDDVILKIYDKGFSIETNTFQQIINYDHIETIEHKQYPNQTIWDISITNQNYICIYFYRDENNQDIINKALNYIKTQITNNPRSIQKDIPQITGNHPPEYQQPITQIHEKSKLIAAILHIILIGLGYAYLNQWGKFITVLLIAAICIATSFLVIPVLILIILWIYTLINTINLVDKYNNGEIY